MAADAAGSVAHRAGVTLAVAMAAVAAAVVGAALVLLLLVVREAYQEIGESGVTENQRS